MRLSLKFKKVFYHLADRKEVLYRRLLWFISGGKDRPSREWWEMVRLFSGRKTLHLLLSIWFFLPSFR